MKKANEHKGGNAASQIPELYGFSAIFVAQQAMLETSQVLAEFWVRSAQSLMSDTTDLAEKLAKCSSPAEAPIAFGQWMQMRLTKLMADSQQAANMCQNAVMTAFTNGRTDQV